ncbi:hypothetical protein [uncultured Photobacterium sp.]|uniref:hypothetical protein n=1 Tax=uncultured Photobacterium sp. TaxID=173973 RepID=UPI0026050740|nr:hypothetical protein [uncultured Photobacterium sp.]
MHLDNLKLLQHKLQEKKAAFIADHDFLLTNELSSYCADITSLIQLNQILCMEVNGMRQFPTFQFTDEGVVHEVLKLCLPRLLNSGRSAWDICFWLYQELSVTLRRTDPDAARLKDVSFEEMLELGKQAKEQTERYIGRPIDAVRKGNDEVFLACVEHLLNPDYREIPKL